MISTSFYTAELWLTCRWLPAFAIIPSFDDSAPESERPSCSARPRYDKKPNRRSAHGTSGSYDQTQRIAKVAQENGCSGILTPSAQSKSRTNLITSDATRVAMGQSQNPMVGEGYSCSASDLRFVQAWKESRPRPKGAEFPKLAESLEDPMLTEIIWLFYGSDSLRIINSPLGALNSGSRRLRFWRKDTIVSLVATREGKRRVWQMLHDASAWM